MDWWRKIGWYFLIRSNTVSCSAIANTLKENLMEGCDVQQHLSKKEIKKMLLKFAELL